MKEDDDKNVTFLSSWNQKFLSLPSLPLLFCFWKKRWHLPLTKKWKKEMSHERKASGKSCFCCFLAVFIKLRLRTPFWPRTRPCSRHLYFIIYNPCVNPIKQILLFMFYPWRIWSSASLRNEPKVTSQALLKFVKFFNFYFIYFLAVLGLRCCPRAFSSCGEWGLLFVAVRGLLIAVASLVVEHGL